MESRAERIVGGRPVYLLFPCNCCCSKFDSLFSQTFIAKVIQYRTDRVCKIASGTTVIGDNISVDYNEDIYG